MFTSKIARHIFIPAAAIVAEKAKSATAECVCKPSELPIYTHSEAQKNSNPEVCLAQEPGAIENAFGTARRNIYSLIAEVKTWEQIGQEYVNGAVENAECVLEYLQEEENTAPKYGAVALGGLAGFILGLRGGMFRRTLYGSIGALGMAAICYPKEANEYGQIVGVEAKRYATIAYNFINGVKKDDPPLALPSLPSLPGSLSEAWDAAKSIGKPTSPVTVSEGQCDDKDASKDKDEVEIDINPLGIIAGAHDVATSQSCHCPIGACMGHHEESPPEPPKDPCVKETPETGKS